VRAIARAHPACNRRMVAGRALGWKRRSADQSRAISARSCQKPTARPGEVGGAERGGLGGARADDGHAEQVGLELHEGVVADSAAVDAELAEFAAAVGLHGAEQVGALVGDALERGAGEVAGVAAARQAGDDAARGRVPMRRPEPGEGGHEVDAAVVGDLAASFSTSTDFAMRPRPSRSHCTTAPPMKTEPSSAYSVRPSIRQAIVVSRLFLRGDGFGRRCACSRKQPVP
jgi:hypothetical protein